jgi:hypothetical protein
MPSPSCPVRARTCRPRGWPWPAGQTNGRTLGAGGVPSPSGLGPYPSVGRSPRTGDVRTVEGSAMSVARPAATGCPQEELIGGDGVQAGVQRPHPGGSARPAGLQACRQAMARSSRCRRAIDGWVRGPTSGSSAEACSRDRSGRRTRAGTGGVSGCRQATPLRWRWRLAGGSVRRR